MHPYVQQTIAHLRQDPNADGRGGYLRIKADAAPERVRAYLIEERDTWQEELGLATMPPQILQTSGMMQTLILAEWFLAEPNTPVSARALEKAQTSVGRLSENIEEAVIYLKMMTPGLLEVVEHL